MRYVLLLACLVACGGDPSYRALSGEITPVPWRCKPGTDVGSWRDRHGYEHSCPAIEPIFCTGPHGGIRQYFIVVRNVFLPDEGAASAGSAGHDTVCERIQRAGD